MRRAILIPALLIILLAPQIGLATAWSNGGYSADTNNPDYGTHDWIAQHALDWLPEEQKQYITDNLASYLYGTELPDLPSTQGGIGDTTKHHIDYSAAGLLQDDAAAVRVEAEYQTALTYLKAGNNAEAAKHAGAMTHYIADMAVFGHVMGATTDWGTETHHSDYENHVTSITTSYTVQYIKSLQYDGTLTTLSAGNAAKQLALDTTLDAGATYTASWMDQNYDWSSSTFTNRSWESVNLTTNAIADTLNTLYNEANPQTTQPKTGAIKITVVDEKNTPLAGASITTTSTPTGQTSLHATTPTNGTITFNPIMIGAYTFNTTKTGYKSNTTTTNTTENQTTSKTIRLTKINNEIPSYPIETITLGFILFLGYSIINRMNLNKFNKYKNIG